VSASRSLGVLLVLALAASGCELIAGINERKASPVRGPDASFNFPDSAGTGGAKGAGGVPGSDASSVDVPGAGGRIETGGATGVGGAITGGTVSTGGAILGGTVSVGGSAITGGIVAFGGTVATGGKTASGGVVVSGGVIGTGGLTVLGGASSTGGTGTIPSSGGLISSGGVMGTGGNGSGGATRTGGQTGGASGGGTGGSAPCNGAAPLNYGKTCGFCSGTVACDASCTRADTSCAPTGPSMQFRNELVMSGDVPPADHVLDTYSGAPFDVFINTNCCTGGVWSIDPIATGGYVISNHAFTDPAGFHIALESHGDAVAGFGLQLTSVSGNFTTPTPAQTWTFTALAGGKFRLTNAALGPGWSLQAPLDLATWNYVSMAISADVPAQRWVVSKL
jgi:hypothetical protein